VLNKPIRGARIDVTNPLARGLVGCWLMNEGTGSIIADLSGKVDAGTITNGVWTAEGVNLESGTDGIINIGTAIDFQTADDFSFFVVGITRANWNHLIGHRDGATYQYQFRVRDLTQYLSLLVGSGSIDSTLSATAGVKNYMGLSRGSGVSTTFFLNGDTQTIGSAGTITNQSLDASIGNELSLGQVITSVSIAYAWDRALSDNELQQIYVDPYQIFDTGLNPAIFGGLTVASGRLSRYHNLNGLGGLGQQTFNPMG